MLNLKFLFVSVKYFNKKNQHGKMRPENVSEILVYVYIYIYGKGSMRVSSPCAADIIYCIGCLMFLKGLKLFQT